MLIKQMLKCSFVIWSIVPNIYAAGAQACMDPTGIDPAYMDAAGMDPACIDATGMDTNDMDA